MRLRYWSEGRFPHWLKKIYNIESPHSLTSKGWREWEESYKASNPKLYWFTEIFLNRSQEVLSTPIDWLYTGRSYIMNRYFYKTHYLPTNLTPGKYHDINSRITHGVIGSLIQYVEIDCANKLSVDDYNEFIEFFKFKLQSSPKRGMRHLAWEISLFDKSEPQSNTALEVMELYIWAKYTRPNRVPPYVKSGYEAFMESRQKTGIGGSNDWIDVDTHYSPDEELTLKAIMLKNEEIHDQYFEEDTEQLIRIIKLREKLWD